MRKIESYSEKIDKDQSPIKYARKKLPTLWKEDSDIIVLALFKTENRARWNSVASESETRYMYTISKDNQTVLKYVEDWSEKNVSMTDRVCDYCGNRMNDIFVWGREEEHDGYTTSYCATCDNKITLNVHGIASTNIK